MSTDYQRIEAAIGYIHRHLRRQPGLEDVAAAAGLSPYHFQRLFRRWAGVSPKRLLEILTVDHAKALLRDSASVLDASLDLGLSGPARLHDHFVTLEAATPGQFKRGGAGLALRWGVHDSPFGAVFIAATGRGICRLSFLDGAAVDGELAALEEQWPLGSMARDQAETRPLAAQVFSRDPGRRGRLALLVQGTNFQVSVWRALLRIPPGAVCSYRRLAAAIGAPGAARAVGGAVGANPVAYLIPCHRVIRELGGLGGYRWGLERKRSMLAWEAAAAVARAQ